MPGADAVMLDIVLDGSVTIEQGAHTDVRPGSIGISDLRKPLVQRFDAKRRSRSLVAEIAQSEIGMDGPAPSVVHASDGIGHLIAGQAQLLFADCDQLDGPTRAVAGIALVSLVRHALSGVPKGGDRFSVRVRALLADHPSDAALDVDALARRLDVSRRTLFRHLAAEGTTPSHLLRDERLRKASAALALIAPSRSITAVALDHGFADHAHFSRAFKAKFGMTPTEFRKLRMAAFH